MYLLKKSECKVDLAIETHVVQGSTVDHEALTTGKEVLRVS